MSLFVDCLSIISILGIWPRFIEPKMVFTTEIAFKLKEEHQHLDPLTIVQLSDLHFHKNVSDRFLDKVVRKICRKRPDLILFTGDFLCYSQLEDEERLKKFLQRLEAPMGCFCIFGNHDYSQYVSRNVEGMYDVIAPIKPLEGMKEAMRTIFSSAKIRYGVTDAVLSIQLHERLCACLKQTPFELLENATVTLPIGLNITGLGDMALGRCRPETAFAGYNRNFPGIILSHNPDSLPQLLHYPGEWIFSGHTHGEQIHFPWPRWLNKISQKLARLEHPRYTRGLFSVGDKKIYINRGLGGHTPFRFCSPPEISVIKILK